MPWLKRFSSYFVHKFLYGPESGIIQSNFDRILWKVNQVIYNLYSNCKPDIMILAQAVLEIFWLLFHTKQQSRKREIIQSNIHRMLTKVNQVIYTFDTFYMPNIYRILPKVNQFIYTLDTICMQNIMTLAQAVLQIFCSQGPLWVKCLSPKRRIIQSDFDRILWKVNQMSYTYICSQSKMISNDQELIQSDPTSHLQNQKGNN